MTESLQWHPVSERMPDADTDVLMWCVGAECPGDWHPGYFDGSRWLYYEGYAVQELTVTHWAQPKGPQ